MSTTPKRTLQINHATIVPELMPLARRDAFDGHVMFRRFPERPEDNKDFVLR